MTSTENYDKLGNMLVDQAVPMKARYRALFTLKNLGGKDAVKNISKGFQDPSALLKHECAYCLGQMQGYIILKNENLNFLLKLFFLLDETAIDYLIAVLKNQTEDPMVRHEAGKSIK